MDSLTVLTNELKETISKIQDTSKVTKIISDHIRSAEKKNYVLPDFPCGLDWFNVHEPLTTSMLKQKIVMLDFFTYCCVNCLHIIPHLREIETKYPVDEGLVVIGVHSAKFDNEKDSANVLSAIKKYNISHPVCNDKDCVLWNKLNISCWPTVLIIGPENKILFSLIGEGHKEEMLLYIKNVMDYYKDRISTEPLPIFHSDRIITSSLLHFPTKVTRLEDQFAVSDCGLHRIIVFNKEGVIKFIIGGKAPGFKDGNFHEAKFNSPQGLTFYDANTLYVADTENHAIRLVNLQNLTVTTVVGNGRQGTDYIGGKFGVKQVISSPWDVCVVPCSDVCVSGNLSMDAHSFPALVKSSGSTPPPPPLVLTGSQCFGSAPPPPPPPPGLKKKISVAKSTCSSRVLLIATAGTHQIWAYFIESGVWWRGKKHKENVCVAIAGTGKEENRNNCYPNLASFAQPSGLTYSPELKAVFISDSESSTIRKLCMENGSVSHVTGGNRAPDDLFSFGDVDGTGYEAKLQHPIGITWNPKDRELLVCDTYNHKIKSVYAADGTCASLRIKDKTFNEPSGCCVNEAGDILYVCDTNNGEIKTVDLNTFEVNKLELREKSNSIARTVLEGKWNATCHLGTGSGLLRLIMEFGSTDVHGNWKLNLKEVDRIKVESPKGKINRNKTTVVMEFPPSVRDSSFSLSLDMVLCGTEICQHKSEVLEVTVKRVKDADAVVTCNVKCT